VRGTNLPSNLVLSTCPEILTFAQGDIRSWHDLVRLAYIVRPMMGITVDLWGAVMNIMAAIEASVVIAAMLERVTEIKNLGAYPRTLTMRSKEARFSSSPMVMAFGRRSAAWGFTAVNSKQTAGQAGVAGARVRRGEV
jgi:replication initiation protein RepC